MTKQEERKQWVFGNEQMHGRVLRIVRERGFAFIQAGTTDYFMHSDDYDGDFAKLQEQQEVRFTPVTTPKGARACDVVRARL